MSISALENKRLAPAVYLILSILLAHWLFASIKLVMYPGQREMICYYYDPIAAAFIPEKKLVPFGFGKSDEDFMRDALGHYLSGPRTTGTRQMLPPEVRLKKVIINNDSLFLNFSRNYLEGTMKNNEELFIEGLLKTINKNFKNINRVKVSAGIRPYKFFNSSKHRKYNFFLK